MRCWSPSDSGGAWPRARSGADHELRARPSPDGAGQRAGRDRKHRRRPGRRACRDRRHRQRGGASSAPWPSQGPSWPATQPPGWLPAPIRLEHVGPVDVRVRSLSGERTTAVVGVGLRRSPQEGLDARPLGRFVGREPPLAALAEAVAHVPRGPRPGGRDRRGAGNGNVARLVTELRRSLSGERITLDRGPMPVARERSSCTCR